MSGTSWMFSSSHQRTATGEAQVAEQRRTRRKHRSTAPQRQQQQHEEEQQQKQHEQLDDPLGFLTRINVRAAPPADGKRRASLDGPPTDESSGDEAGAAGPRSPKAVQPLAYAAVGALTAYYGIKGILGGYQQLRRRNLRALIRTVSPVLGSLGATYWLDFGSLLGAHREGDVIAHDNDADVVVLNPDWDELLVALRAALPQYRVFFVVPSEDRSIRWIRLLNGVGVMDVYGAFDGGAAAPGMISIPQGHGDLCDIPRNLVFPLGTLKFRGVPVSAPGDVHGTLAYRYGSDYMVPKYMHKGRDSVEQGKMYARLLGLLGKAGLRV